MPFYGIFLDLEHWILTPKHISSKSKYNRHRMLDYILEIIFCTHSTVSLYYSMVQYTKKMSYLHKKRCIIMCPSYLFDRNAIMTCVIVLSYCRIMNKSKRKMITCVEFVDNFLQIVRLSVDFMKSIQIFNFSEIKVSRWVEQMSWSFQYQWVFCECKSIQSNRIGCTVETGSWKVTVSTWRTSFL